MNEVRMKKEKELRQGRSLKEKRRKKSGNAKNICHGGHRRLHTQSGGNEAYPENKKYALTVQCAYSYLWMD
jgi:hypothetical protein